MLTAEENERLTQVGLGTPMGELMRRYWHPVAASSELDEEPTKLVKVLGETLVLYRDRQGRHGLIAEPCAHRRASMLFGIPENEGLRCAYHGWMYDQTGQCIEQPAEDMEAADSTLRQAQGRLFRERVKLTAYPVQELGGLIFAYLGPEPAPLLPRWEPLVRENAQRSIGTAVIPCNWLQIMENSLDPTHVEWLHRRFDNYVLERLGRPDLLHPVRHHKRIGFDVFEYGIVKRRVWQGGTEDDPEWRLGHPVLFPNMLGFGQIRVPIDDANTLYWWYHSRPLPPGAPPQDRVPLYQVPVPGVNERGHPTWDLLDNNSGQDILMWYTQGPIADRSEEKLGTADKGIILYRKLLEENIEKVQRGEDPLGVIRDPSVNGCIHIATEYDAGGIEERRLRSVGDRRPTGQSGKYDPLLSGMTALEAERETVPLG